MKLYIVTLDPAYYEPLLKALNFVLEAQFPNGAWPQRYPLMYEYVKNGKPDYTSFYTFNDGVMFNNIMVLLDAYEQLGDERYYEAARRGMDFYIVSQYARPQAGWSSQHSHDMKPTYARTYEPEGVWSTSTLNNINALETFYKITGDRRYLNPIPAAVEWLESAILNTDPSKNYTHARVYELGTNKPLYTHRSGTGIENGHYYQDHEFGNFICHYGQIATIDVKAIQKEYDRVCGLTPENARAEFEQSGKNNRTAPDADSAAIETLIKSLDKRGAWITDMRISNYSDPCADGRAGTIVRGIETGVYIGNMKKLMDYVKSVKK